MSDDRAGKPQDAPHGASIVLAWTLAWWLTGVTLYISGVLNSPRTGPLWAALAGGMLAWGLAGAYTFRSAAVRSTRWLNAALLAIWALVYLVSFASAGLAGTALDNAFGGFIYMVLGWAVGPAIGAFASTLLFSDTARIGRSALVGGIWLLGSFVGGHVALVGLYIGPELGKISIGALIGQPAALTLGAGLGMALGGLIASAIAVPLTRRVTRRLE